MFLLFFDPLFKLIFTTFFHDDSLQPLIVFRNGRLMSVNTTFQLYNGIAIGEVGLGGEVRNVTNLEYRLRESQRMGFVRAVVPKYSLAQIDPKEFNTMELLGVTYVKQAIQLL